MAYRWLPVLLLLFGCSGMTHTTANQAARVHALRTQCHTDSPEIAKADSLTDQADRLLEKGWYVHSARCYDVAAAIYTREISLIQNTGLQDELIRTQEELDVSEARLRRLNEEYQTNSGATDAQ
jgi:hypothetical protein